MGPGLPGAGAHGRPRSSSCSCNKTCDIPLLKRAFVWSLCCGAGGGITVCSQLLFFCYGMPQKSHRSARGAQCPFLQRPHHLEHSYSLEYPHSLEYSHVLVHPYRLDIPIVWSISIAWSIPMSWCIHIGWISP